MIGCYHGDVSTTTMTADDGDRAGLVCSAVPPIAPPVTAPTAAPTSAPVAAPTATPTAAPTIAPTAGQTAPPTDAAARPNVLIFQPDDLHHYWDDAPPHPAGVAGPLRAPTPHMDALRAEGTVFTSAYTSSPMCAPSRFGLVTGRCAHHPHAAMHPRHPAATATHASCDTEGTRRAAHTHGQRLRSATARRIAPTCS